jgi:hypothetical protein
VCGGDVTFGEHSSETSVAKEYGFGAMFAKRNIPHTHTTPPIPLWDGGLVCVWVGVCGVGWVDVGVCGGC